MEETSSDGEGQRDASVWRSDKKRRYRLEKEDRVRLSSEYRRIMTEGTRYRTRHFRIQMLQNQVGKIRLGITVSRKVGKACVRNRIKRRLREYFRLNRDKIPAGTDLVFVATKAAASLETGRIQEELDRFFESGH